MGVGPPPTVSTRDVHAGPTAGHLVHGGRGHRALRLGCVVEQLDVHRGISQGRSGGSLRTREAAVGAAQDGEQVEAYAERRGEDPAESERWLAPNLAE